MGINKGLKSVIICVLILGLVLEQVQVEGKSCCPNRGARNCFNVCEYAGVVVKSDCANTCGCLIINGGTCPWNYPSLHLHPVSHTPNAIKFCNIGCKSSVCDSINNEANIKGVELCGSACADICNKISVVESVAA